MSPRYDVFLSHSTADEAAVEELAHKLVAAGITPFLDKWYLVPGEPWQEALEQALDASSTCAVFLGPGGMGAWHYEEMRAALETRVGDKRFRVIPILLPGSFEPRKEQLPHFLRRLAWVDFRGGLDDRDAFHRLLSGIRGTAPVPGEGGGGPAKPRSMAQPPEAFVHRREYHEVLEALCPPAGAPQPAAVGITTALRGAGGFGKTDLAQAICQDPRVWQTYPDGILWTTMGEDIDAHGRLAQVRDLIRWWTYEKENPTFENVSVAGARLRELLARSRVLLVIDDVWSSADLTPFQGLAKGSALLVTTRDRQTLPDESRQIDVDAMAASEAVTLLRLGLPGGSTKEFESLAARLGEWPLLLKLVNRQLRELVNEDGRSVPKALQDIEQALDFEGFSAFDRDDKDSRHAAASQAILVSVRRLPEKEHGLYFQLAIFPEDAQIPFSVLSRFWGLSEFQIRKFCRRLHDLSLLLDFDGERETVRLHDVVRRVLIEQVGTGLSSLHGRLLDLFKPATGLWSDLPAEESYLWRNLDYHFIGAERRAQLRDLASDFSFLDAALKATDVNALIVGYGHLADEVEPRLIRDAIRLSAHVLAWDRLQLAPQLIGRLKAKQEESIQRLVRGAESWKGACWLRPRTASLVQPGGALRVLEGHTGWVSAMAGVDGRRVISAFSDGTLRLWDLETGQTLRTFEGHRGLVLAVALVDSRRVISASEDRTLRLWDLETGQTLRTLEGHTEGILAVAVVGDRRAVSASADGTLRLWDLVTGQILRILEEHTDGVNAVAVVDDRRVISAYGDGTLRVWDLDTGQILRTLEGRTEGILAVAVVGGRRAVSASIDGTLRMWDLETGQSLRTLEHRNGILAVAVVDDRRAISGSFDGTLRVWDLETGQTLKTLEGHLYMIRAVAVLGGHCAVSASVDGTLRLWDLETVQTLSTLEGHTDVVSAVAVIDGRRVVSASWDRTLRLWELETGQILRTFEGHTDKANAVAVVDGRRAVSTSKDGTLRLWDLETGQTLRILEGHTEGVLAVAVMGGHGAVSASKDGTLRLWDLETGQTLRTLEGHTEGVLAVAVMGGRRAVSASDDGTLRLWDLETGETLRTFEHTFGATAVAVVDDRRAVSASKDGTLWLWDLETGQTLGTFEGHTDEVHAVAVMDGRHAVSVSSDRTLQLWDLETGERLYVTTLDAPASAIAAAPDGRVVVAGDFIGRVHFFDLVEPA